MTIQFGIEKILLAIFQTFFTLQLHFMVLICKINRYMIHLLERNAFSRR